MPRTNDPKHPQTKLVITGLVETTVTIEPRHVQLRGPVDREIVQEVAIIPHPKRPFGIKTVTTSMTHPKSQAPVAEKIAHSLRTVEDATGTKYVLTVRNLQEEPGTYSYLLRLITDNPQQPEIKISVYGQLEAAPAKQTPRQ